MFSQRAEVSGSCEPSYGSWELNWGLLEEQPVLLTAESSLQATYSAASISLGTQIQVLVDCPESSCFSFGDSLSKLPELMLQYRMAREHVTLLPWHLLSRQG